LLASHVESGFLISAAVVAFNAEASFNAKPKLNLNPISQQQSTLNSTETDDHRKLQLSHPIKPHHTAHSAFMRRSLFKSEWRRVMKKVSRFVFMITFLFAAAAACCCWLLLASVACLLSCDVNEVQTC